MGRKQHSKRVYNKIGKRAGTCWSCGTRENITLHHALPRRMAKYRNIQIPLCTRCHRKIENFWKRQGINIVVCQKCGSRVNVNKKNKWVKENDK